MSRNQQKGMAMLALGALGVVFGDIGTSPLYVFAALFGEKGYNLALTHDTVVGCIALIIWSITLTVSIKFIGFIMRADSDGEGGIMVLVARLRKTKLHARYTRFFTLLGLIGVALFYGDVIITPAISVLSAVEGLKVVAPNLESLIIPITLGVLTSLFALQRYGTNLIGKLFGPVMLVWFAVMAAGGLMQIWLYPDILWALSPMAAIGFIINSPLVAFIAMGAVVLAVTGVEALYADMGHFGRVPISRAWFFIVCPALVLSYMGEGALLLRDPSAVANPFLLQYPESMHVPIVILSMLATVIASQAVISGVFSLTRQAMQLNFLPKLLVRHTSSKIGGQIYLPFVSWLLFVAVVLLVVTFGSSANLAGAYGIAVSGTLVANTILYLVLMYYVWHRSMRRIILAAAIFLPIDLVFVAASLPRVVSGGWLPIVVAGVVFVIIVTWLKGEAILARERRLAEGPLQDFVNDVHVKADEVARVEGAAVYISEHPEQTPMALYAAVNDLHELHRHVLVVTVTIATVPHVPKHERALYDKLGFATDGISRLQLTFGFHDVVNVPAAIVYAQGHYAELDFAVDEALFFISLSRVVKSTNHRMMNWRKSLYMLLARNDLSESDYYKLPIERTVEMRSLAKL